MNLFQLQLIAVAKKICGDRNYKKVDAMKSRLLSFEFKKATSSGQGALKLSDCFEHFSKLDKLENDNKWYCSKCKEQVDATK